MVGIDKTKEVLTALSGLVADCIMLTKGGLSFSNMARILAIISQIRGIVSDAADTLEELKDLDVAESVELSQLCLVLVQDLVRAVLAGNRGG